MIYMKYIQLLFFLLIIVCEKRINAQDTIPLIYNQQKDVFTGNDMGKGILYWNNSILSYGIGVIDSLNQRGFSITNQDTLGNIIWEKVFTSPHYDYFQPNDILSFNDNSFYLAGIIVGDQLTAYDRFLMKLDQNGDSIFFRTYIDEQSNFLLDLEMYSIDRLLFLSAEQEVMYDEYVKTTIELVDTCGNIITSNNSNYKKIYPRKFIFHNAKIFVGGDRITESDHIEVYIDIYDTTLCYMNTSYPSTTLNERFRDFTSVNNDLFLTSDVTSYFYPDPRPHHQISISKLDNNGQYLHSNAFGPSTIHWPNTAGTINVNNNYLLTYVNCHDIITRLHFHDLQLGHLCGYDVEWPWWGLQFAWIHDISLTPSNKVAGIGSTYRYGSRDQWSFLTVDAVNFLENNCIYVELNELSFHNNNNWFYPNPATNHITIAAEYNELNIYNMLGQRVMHNNEYKKHVDLLTFEFGLYIVEIVDKDGRSRVKLIIK